jgi:hypothetical protein
MHLAQQLGAAGLLGRGEAVPAVAPRAEAQPMAAGAWRLRGAWREMRADAQEQGSQRSGLAGGEGLQVGAPAAQHRLTMNDANAQLHFYAAEAFCHGPHLRDPSSAHTA